MAVLHLNFSLVEQQASHMAHTRKARQCIPGLVDRIDRTFYYKFYIFLFNFEKIYIAKSNGSGFSEYNILF